MFFSENLRMHPDSDFIRQLIDGVPQAEKKFNDLFKDKIWEVVSYHLGEISREDIEDVVAEIRLATVKSLQTGKFDPEKGSSLESYIFGILYKKISDFKKYKNTRRHINNTIETIPEPAFEAGDYLERKEEAEKIKKVISKLPKKYQEVLYLKFYKDLRVSEISECIQLAPRRVSERIHYGLKLFKKHYEKIK